MQDKVLKRDIETSGGWFVGEYAAIVVDKYHELENDQDFKNEFIRDIFHNQGRDSDYRGTRVRINALLRIIRNNKIIEALEYVIDSERINKDDPKAVEMAKEILFNIRSN